MSNKKLHQMGISKRLGQVIDEFGLTVTGFASVVDLPYRTVQNYLRGEREPNAAALAKIADHACVNINWLLAGKGEMLEYQYLDKDIVDTLLLELLNDVLLYSFDKKKRKLNERQYSTLMTYLTDKKATGVQKAIRTLVEEVHSRDFPALAAWLNPPKDIGAPVDKKRTKERSRGRRVGR